MVRNTLFFLFLFPALLFSQDESLERDPCCSLLYDLEVANFWTLREQESLPITFNHLYSSGYFTTPSARMGEAGEIGVGFAYLYPYSHWNARVMPFDRLELSINWRLFHGIKDPGLSPSGFGDYADRGANIKLALVTPEDSLNELPGLAIGAEDFMGTKKFTTYFVVCSKVWLPEGLPLETSLGYGTGRFDHGPSKGFFGGFSWFPFWRGSREALRPLSLDAEWDPVNYKDPNCEPHAGGRISHCPVNFGVKYKLQELVDLSLGYMRGDRWAYAGSIQYNWGATKGILPKINDPLPFTAPINKEPIGCSRPASLMAHNLAFALEDQGFLLVRALLLDEKTLLLSIINENYREEEIVRMRLQHLLASLSPSSIEKIIVVIESYGLPCQQYVYTQELLCRYAHELISPFEFDLLTPRKEARYYCDEGELIFESKLDPWRWRASPRFESFLGSSHGKFKYDLGVFAGMDGYLPYHFTYDLQVSYTLLSTLNKMGIVDIYNPSQLPVVLTDYVRYRQQSDFSLDMAYLQRCWNMGAGYFSRLAAGYFQVNYAGVAGETLWYPTRSHIAVGAEAAFLKKRKYSGLGFQSKLLQFEGFIPTFHSYSLLPQYFINLYLDFPEFSCFGKVSAGQFLAGDHGLRLEATRYFESGLRLTAWITVTDAKDQMHGEEYFNKGIAIELPFDIFYLCSSRRVWNYGTAAWLRDAGAFTWTGQSLFEILNRERR